MILDSRPIATRSLIEKVPSISTLAKLKLAWSSGMCVCTCANVVRHPVGQTLPIWKHSDLRPVRKGRETFVKGYLQSEIVEARDDSADSAGRGRPSGTRWQGRSN